MNSMAPMSSLREEHQSLLELLDVLKQEQQHLVAADIDNLALATARKTELVLRMTLLANQRQSALGAAGHAAADAGMETWLAASGEADAQSLWRQVLDLTAEAKEINRLNGTLINRHMAYTQNALNALNPPAPSGNFYGPSGHATNAPTSRRLVVG